MLPAVEIAVAGGSRTALIAAACLADLGHCVTLGGLDDHAIASQIGAEPGFASFVETQRLRGQLIATAAMATAASAAVLVFLAADHDAPREAVLGLAQQIIPALRPNASLVIHAACAPGTADAVATLVAAMRAGAGINVLSNPPFTGDDQPARDFLNADRIVIGADNAGAARALARVYNRLSLEDAPVVYTSRHGAELIAQSCRTLAAMHAAFAQDVLRQCGLAGIDPRDVARGVALDRQANRPFLDELGLDSVSDLAARQLRMVGELAKRHQNAAGVAGNRLVS